MKVKTGKSMSGLVLATTLGCFAAAALSSLTGCNRGSTSPPIAQASNRPAQPMPAPSSPFAGASAFLTGPEAPARAVAVTPSGGRNFTTAGSLVVEHQGNVVAERDGRVTAVKVEIGDHVHRGQVLALLDDRARAAERAEKVARIHSLQIQLQTWEAEQKRNVADLRQPENTVSAADREHLNLMLEESRTRVARCKTDLLAAQADLHTAEVELDQSRILAPFDGVVGRRSVQEAQEVKKGQGLFWVSAQAPLRITFKVPESAMAFFARGAKLELTTADYPRLKQPANVFRVSPVVDSANGTVEVIGNLEKPSPLLKPGMSMHVKLSQR